MSIVVTGSAGHLGEALVRTLRASGRPVIGVDRKSSPFTTHVGSISDRAFVQACMEGATAVVHAATLHKPHVGTHSWQEFVDTNVTGTLVVLEAAVAAGIRSFTYISTTAVFGLAGRGLPGGPAAWVVETLAPRPANIYGVSKFAAEQLCELAHRKHRLPLVVLRTARFFPEEDDNPNVRTRYGVANAQANELLYRRVDIADAVAAVLLSIDRGPTIGFGRYIIAATTPFEPSDLAMLGEDAPRVVRRLFPDSESLFAAHGWSIYPTIDRVYVNALARAELGWTPTYDFAHVLDCLRSGREFRSPLAREVGSKGYHDRVFADGPYPV